MLHHHGVILVAILLLPFFPVDNSYIARHYRQTLLVVGEVQRARNGRRYVVLLENKVREHDTIILRIL